MKMDLFVDCDKQKNVVHNVLHHVEKLLDAATPPDIPSAFTKNEDFVRLHEKIILLRDIITSFASGDLSPQITMSGVVAGSCKALQANLRHMTWKVQQVENGDYSQRMDFMGDFSSSFNSMVVQLASTIEALQQKEASLQEEARQRNEAMRQLEQSEAKFKYMAQHDPLTGVFNRRFFFFSAMEQMERCFAMRRNCCYCLLDVDHFKKFNDTYGHVEGDWALKHIVEHAQKSLRRADIMGRYGGEEFIFFFSDADFDQGLAAAERTRLAVENTPCRLQDGRKIPLTVSMGVAGLLAKNAADQNSNTLQQWAIKQADNALYKAKNCGRNRVCVSEPSVEIGE